MRYQLSWTVLAEPGTSPSPRCRKADSQAFWTRQRGTSDEMTWATHFEWTNNRRTPSSETRLQRAHRSPSTEGPGQATAASLSRHERRDAVHGCSSVPYLGDALNSTKLSLEQRHEACSRGHGD
jgi:hypothetical protein